MLRGIAYKILTPRLCLRCWEPRDAPALLESITGSLDHLRASMVWGQWEPTSLEEKVDQLRKFRAAFDARTDFIYGIFDRDEQRLLGGTGLHPRVYEGGVEIGYWMDARHLRRGYGSEATAALTRVAFEVERLDRVEVHIDTRNKASAGIPTKLGFRHVGTLPCSVKSPGGVGDRMIWMMLREDFVPSVPIEVFDAAGRAVELAE